MRAVITVVGKDAVGILAKVSGRCSDHRVNVIEVTQSILQDVFDIYPEHYTLMEYDGCINLVKAAIVCADRVTTVSPTYANEILTPEYSHRLNFILANNSHKLGGILNGIDTKYYDPLIDKDIYVNYGLESLDGKKENKLAFQREFALPEDPDAPQTGDDFNTVFWVSLLLASVTVIFFILLFKKKKNVAYTQYLRELRIKHAIFLMETVTRLKAGEVIFSASLSILFLSSSPTVLSQINSYFILLLLRSTFMADSLKFLSSFDSPRISAINSLLLFTICTYLFPQKTPFQRLVFPLSFLFCPF